MSTFDKEAHQIMASLSPRAQEIFKRKLAAGYASFEQALPIIATLEKMLASLEDEAPQASISEWTHTILDIKKLVQHAVHMEEDITRFVLLLDDMRSFVKESVFPHRGERFDYDRIEVIGNVEANILKLQKALQKALSRKK